MKPFEHTLILGVETSCDETGISLLRCDTNSFRSEILAEAIHSQVTVHEEYGGVVPELAAREHLRNLPLLYGKVLQESGKKIEEISSVAVTCGPGLKGCLLCGMLFASGLAEAHGLQLIPVNHIEAHALSVFIDHPEVEFPYLCLVVSGGHTELHLVNGIGDYTLLARSIDDAAGEAFDKSAKLLGLGYPGGPALAKLGDLYKDDTSRFELPKVMAKQTGFSFSGLKTAIALLIKKEADVLETEDGQQEIAWTIQDGIVSALTRKVKKAQEMFSCDTLCVCGGVSANQRLRKKLEEIQGLNCIFPDFRHCMDNGTMIALASHLRSQANLQMHPFEAFPRWPIETAREERI